MKPICRHCKKFKVSRPRGLCYGCSKHPEIRALYPSVYEKNRGNRGVEDFCGQAPLPAVPTGARPGSPEKIEVLKSRAAVRQALHHPADEALRGNLPALPMFLIPVTMVTGAEFPAEGVLVPEFVTHTFVVGENPSAPGLPDLGELKERVRQWKAENGICELTPETGEHS